jgi:hypothetical protein
MKVDISAGATTPNIRLSWFVLKLNQIEDEPL